MRMARPGNPGGAKAPAHKRKPPLRGLGAAARRWGGTRPLRPPPAPLGDERRRRRPQGPELVGDVVLQLAAGELVDPLLPFDLVIAPLAVGQAELTRLAA